MGNRSDIATAARDYLHEVDTIDVTPTVMARAINRSQLKLNADTGYNRADVTIAMQTGVWEYNIPTTALDVYSVRIGVGANRQKLDPTSKSMLDREYGDWESATAGTPTQYYLDGGKIGVHPKPHGVAAGTTLWAWSVKNPSSLSATGSVPTWLPIRYHDTIAKGAAIDIAGGFSATSEGSNSRIAKLYSEYLGEVREIRKLANARSKETTPTLSVRGYGTYRRDR